jgi:hypothetical protein
MLGCSIAYSGLGPYWGYICVVYSVVRFELVSLQLQIKVPIGLVWYLLSNVVAFKHPYQNGDGKIYIYIYIYIIVVTVHAWVTFSGYFMHIFVVAVRPEHVRGE